MKIDWDQAYSKVYGHPHGARYFQDGAYFDIRGELVGEIKPVPKPAQEAAPVEPVPEPSKEDEPEKPVFDPSLLFGREPVKVPREPEKKHTFASLTKIADKEGISGLREIAKNFGVKGRGKTEIIREILDAQNNGG